MTPEEVELLQDAGQALLYNLSVLVTESVLYGLYIAIFIFGIRALSKRNPWTRYTWILFCFLSVICLIMTVNLATELAFIIILIRGYFVNNPELPLSDRFDLANGLSDGLIVAGVWIGGSGSSGFLFVFADAVVVWRACVLWPRNRKVKVFLWLLLFTSAASVVISSVVETIFFTESDVVLTSSAMGITLTLSQSLSLATNFVATVLIGYKAYRHRQIMKATIGVKNSRSGAILLFLTESGVAFCILQVIAISTSSADNDTDTPLDYTTSVWQAITFFAAAAYPVLVLIIVDSHRSISDHTGGFVADSGFAPQDPNSIASHISFAARSPGGSFSKGTGVGEESVIEARVDPAFGAESHSHEGSVRSRDLEKGERPAAGELLSTGEL